jgi:hypothetical protein
LRFQKSYKRHKKKESIMTLPIQFMTGICYLIIGISFILRTDDWRAWVEHLQKDPRVKSLILGAINLLIGAFVLAFHWIWSGVGMIVTILGCIGILKGAVYVLCPGWLGTKLGWFAVRAQPWFKICGLIMAGLALLLLYDWSIQAGLL